MVTRIQIGPEVVASDDTVTGPFDVKNALSRDSVVYPFGDRLWRNTDGPSKRSLRPESLEDGKQNIGCHETTYIHGQFMTVNSEVIAHNLPVDDHDAMPHRIPQPENYATFAAWVMAMASYAGSQAALARGVGVSPQMITKYLAGKSIEPENLEKFANFSGVSYAKLRLLVDGMPLSDAKNVKERVNQTVTPMGAQVGRQWEQIQDERMRGIIAEQIRMALDNQARLDVATRKRTG
jgi:transcriptional regulator with XRE-family HTH domain